MYISGCLYLETAQSETPWVCMNVGLFEMIIKLKILSLMREISIRHRPPPSSIFIFSGLGGETMSFFSSR